MIAKTREQSDSPSVRNSMMKPISIVKDSNEKYSNGTGTGTKTAPHEKARLSKVLGSRGGLLTKKSTMNMLPKRGEPTYESGKVLRGQMGEDRPVPNKVSVEEEPSASADYTDGRDPEEKARDKQRQDKLDRMYELNKRLRQGGNKDRESNKAVGISNFSSTFEVPSTLTTISTASSTSSANLPSPKSDEERNYTLDGQTQLGNLEAKDTSGITDQQHELDLELCPEIPPGLQVLILNLS